MKDLKSSVLKTFALLEHFTLARPEWGVTELADAIGSNKSTVHRFLADLHRLEILYKHPETDRYSLGLKLFELGNRVQLKSAFVDKTHPILVNVAKSIDETVHLAVLKKNKVYYVDKVVKPHGLTISSNIGSYNSSHNSGLGKVLLAHLSEEEQVKALAALAEQGMEASTPNSITDVEHLRAALASVKERGYGLDREEFEVGLICVAIPVFNEAGVVVASMSASGPAARFEEDHLDRYLKILRQGAATIRTAIGHFQPTIY